jgi:hypothetical protein
MMQCIQTLHNRKFKNPELRTEEGAGGDGERSSLRCEEGRSDRASGDSAHLCFVSVLMASFFYAACR